MDSDRFKNDLHSILNIINHSNCFSNRNYNNNRFVS